MSGDKGEEIDPGFSLFGAEILKKLTEDLRSESDGVRTSDDIEYIHRMRVASRRLRAALPLFASCFPKKMYNQLRKGIRSITRSLGAARDLDVQIDFLQSFLESLPEEGTAVCHAGFLPAADDHSILQGESVSCTLLPAPPETTNLRLRIRLLIQKVRRSLTGRSVHTVPREEMILQPLIKPGIECLLLRWRGRRSALHPGVVSAVDAFEESGIAEMLIYWCDEQIINGQLHDTDIHTRYAYEAAYHAISMRLQNLESFERFVSDPTRITEHHDMRISAKQLRYTMEIFRGLYQDGLKKPIQEIKHLQDLLGDMHDCDVWLEVLPDFIEEEEDRVTAFFGHPGFMRFIRPGLLHLASDRRSSRDELYRLFTIHWIRMKEDGIIDMIRQRIAEPLVGRAEDTARQREGDTIRIALIGDVHANLPALSACISDAAQRGATEILHLGDLVGFGPYPDETVAAIRDAGIAGVAGNIDIETISVSKKECRSDLPKEDEKLLSLCWTRKKLSKENRKYLSSLPRQMQRSAGTNTLLLTHGSPSSLTGRIGSGTPDEELAAYAKLAGVDVIVSAHTHIPWSRSIDGCLFINTGSVGRPADGDPRACYCILETDPVSICHIRIPYDIDSVTEAISRAGLPEIFCTILHHGIGIEEARMLSGDLQNRRHGSGKNQQTNRSITIEPK